MYESVFLDTHPENEAAGGKWNPPSRAASGAMPVSLAKAASYEEYLSFLRPTVNRMSGEWAGLIETRSADGVWEWSEGIGNRLHLRTRKMDVPEHAATLHLSSNVPYLTTPLLRQISRGMLWWLILAQIFALLFLLLGFVVRRVFLLNLDDLTTMIHDDEIDNPRPQSKRFVVLGEPFLDVHWLLNGTSFERVSMEEIFARQEVVARQGVAEKQRTKPADDDKLLAIDNFDYRSDDPEWNLKRLELLERLQHDSRPVIIFSRHDPFRFCLAPSCTASPQQSNAHFPANTTDRWMNAISSFWVSHIEDIGERQAFKYSLSQEKDRQVKPRAQAEGRFILPRYLRRLKRGLLRPDSHLAALYDALAEECNQRSYLQNVGKGVLMHPKFPGLSREQLVRLLVEQAAAYYKAIWATCTTDQKLTLYYLAQDRLVSAKNTEVPRLMRRGLIVRDPDVRLMNESFRRFVISTAVPEEIGAGARTGSSWSRLRWSLLLILLCITLFLLFTQPEMYSSSMAIITALATGIPVVSQLFAMFEHGKPSAAELAQLPGGMTPPAAG